MHKTHLQMHDIKRFGILYFHVQAHKWTFKLPHLL